MVCKFFSRGIIKNAFQPVRSQDSWISSITRGAGLITVIIGLTIFASADVSFRMVSYWSSG